jgi:hypothetical protein
MPESKELTSARRCLAKAEASLATEGGLNDLVEGLALLDDVIAAGVPQAAQTARNLAMSYAARVYERIDALVTQDPQLPEPLLEHCFKVVLAFDHVDVDLPQAALDLKVAVVRRLIDRYYEGHPPEKKQRALEELAQIAGRN